MRYALMSGLVLGLMAGSAGGKIVTQPVPFKVDDTLSQSLLVYDDAVPGKRPGVLVFPEWWGLVDFPKQKAEQLAKMGYAALAVDIYGQGQTTDDPQQAGKLASQFPPPQLRKRAQAALETLCRQDAVDPSRIAAIGFCFGGKVALQLAYSGADVRAVVVFHGDLAPPSADEAGNIKAQILVCTGADDPMIPAQKVDAFWQALPDTATIWQINIYSGAKHSFTNPAADRHNMKGVGHNPVAAERSWSAMQQFFREVLDKAPRTQPAAR